VTDRLDLHLELVSARRANNRTDMAISAVESASAGFDDDAIGLALDEALKKAAHAFSVIDQMTTRFKEQIAAEQEARHRRRERVAS
jgi:hypothetical protein